MAPTEIARNARMGLRLSTEELAMLDAVALDAGLTASDVIRTMIRERYKARFGDKRPRATK